ncbi:hypothetical protein AUJ68_01625 [Candidatus Woesearchaeota archaeon CG1_02_57_44]|nr:MAG: hypothetical protein AUJ68_01625 [Candidatus Woesearchaeota archaeon CG1_02_57_44]PIN70910.1 MAG: hypothetical protein COV94_00620 [Candidatus Woesearchaeota archaeon CG11_big_fil_rev_8_21_14_0_20_57_5]
MASTQQQQTRLRLLEQDIAHIKERNTRVELDKAWETSGLRRLMVTAMTYLVVVSFFLAAKLPTPYLSSLVPAAAYLLSTTSLPWFKRVWLDRQQQKHK